MIDLPPSQSEKKRKEEEEEKVNCLSGWGGKIKKKKTKSQLVGEKKRMTILVRDMRGGRGVDRKFTTKLSR